jgi:flagellar basal-body rod protein FlgG
MEMAFPVAQNGIERSVLTQSVIANNLANLTTTAYKGLRVESGTFRIPGTQAVDTLPAMIQGPLKQTERDLDVAIDGDGFFIVQVDARQGFTRAGNFHVDQDGNIVTAAGYELESQITVPDEAVGVSITTAGEVYARFQDGTAESIGNLRLARFRNSAGLLPIGDNVFIDGPNSGDAIVLDPGEEGAGILRQGFLENANVDEATEITNEIITQRHFQASLRAFQVINDCVGRAVDLSR